MATNSMILRLFVLLLTITYALSNAVPPEPKPNNGTTTAIPTSPTTPSTTTTPTTITPPTNTTTAPTSTTASPPTTKPTPITTPAPSTITTAKPTSTTAAPTSPSTTQPTAAPGPSTTAIPSPTKQPTGRHFDGLSFMGGIIMTACLVGLSVGSYKFYKIKTERSYRTL